MPKPSLPEDREVLRAKFENVNRLLRVYADGIAHAESKLHTMRILRPDVSGEQLVHALRDAMIPLAEAGVDTVLIRDDLAAAQGAAGNDFQSWIVECHSRFIDAQQRVAQAPAGPAGDSAREQAIRSVLTAAVDCLRASLLPAEALRDRLSRVLNRGPMEHVETAGQMARRTRDDRIRFLARSNGTTSPAEVAKLAAVDPVLSRLRDEQTVRLTRDIIRNALSPRTSSRKRLKPARTKNTRQRKNPRNS